MKKILLLLSLVFAFSAYAEDPAPVEISFGEYFKKNGTAFIADNKFSQDGITVYGAQNDNNDPAKFYDGYIRFYKSTSLILECSDAFINKVEITTAEGYPFKADGVPTADSGTFTVNSKTLGTWQSSTSVSSVNIQNSKRATVRMSGLKVYLKAKSTGIDEVGYEADAPVEYFNLLGVRVDESALSAGHIYIRRCGTKAEKVVIR